MFDNRKEKEDYFDKTPEEPIEKPKEPKKPTYKPDDPRYYEEESEWEHLKPSPYRHRRLVLVGSTILIVLLVIIGLWIYFFTPVVDEAETYGYVEKVEKRGTMFKTFEGTILPYRSVMDSARVYDKDFVFSAKTEHIASELRKRQQTGKPVKVEYVIYRTRMPWRGEEKTIVTAVDSVDPRKLLPPDRTPEVVGN